MKTAFILIFTYILCFALVVYPFLPGRYDTSGIVFSTFIQVYSGLGLITVIPASFWIYFSLKVKATNLSNQNLIIRHWNSVKIYIVVNILILSLTILLTQFISRLVCVILFINLICFSYLLFKKIKNRNHVQSTPVYLSVALGILPVSLFVFQLLISKPLTDWSRTKVIQNCGELITQIEWFKSTTGQYPLTLNAINKDYNTGINSVEKYHYTYDDTTYNIYFEQPRFFFDRFGTKEFVVYNPKDNHLMLSHTVWHMQSGNFPSRIYQGWYASQDIGIPHWKSFFFD